MKTRDGDVDHPIVERPWEYTIEELRYHHDPEDRQQSFIDLVLRKGSIRRHLRFLAPQGLEIEDGFPAAPGLCILDVSDRQLGGLRVRVDDFEASSGAVRFWAADVVDVDEEAG